MGLRTQVSLQFSDQAMFDEFIVPRRDERTLNSLIVRCLTSYYNNPEVRALIDDEVVDAQSTDDIISNVRNFVTMQDILMSNLEDTIAEGKSDFADVFNKANKQAEDSGVTAENAAEVMKPKISEKNDSVVLQSNQVSAIFDALAILASAIGSKDALELIDSNRGGIPRITSSAHVESKVSSEVEEESAVEKSVTSESSVQEQVPVDLKQPEPSKSESTPEAFESSATVEELPRSDEPEKIESVAPDSSLDAKNAMMDLLGSL